MDAPNNPSQTPDRGTSVHILADHVARKIAAGEVIDRPHSVVRELMDNAIDAGAKSIDVHMEQGGLRRIVVHDEGVGMHPEDLEICWHAHATSKITSAEDLDRVETLGFRGEALASIAEVARLRVTSAQPGSDTAYRLEVHGGERVDFSPTQSDYGTTVEVRDLFYAMPARRRFLKRPAAESAMVRNIFIEKALPFPDRSFRLFADGSLRLMLPQGELPARIAAAFPDVGAAKALQEITGTGEGFSVKLLAAGPEYSRKDRKLVQTFVNERRVWEYALIQAVEYGFSDYLPGGSHPIAFLFLQVEPERVDFNVHPAKREIRFRNLPEIHHRITRILEDFLRQYALRFPSRSQENASPHTERTLPHLDGSWSAERPRRATEDHLVDRRDAVGQNAARQNPAGHGSSGFDLETRFDPHTAMTGESRQGSVRYLGQIFNLFLLAEYGDTLYIVDQHAGHEKVLFTRFHEETRRQSLLVPVNVEVSAEEDEILESRATELEAIGIEITRRGNKQWELRSVPAVPGIDAEALAEALRELAGTPREVLRDLYATMSCKAAIKDGDPVDPATGQALLQAVFSLNNAHCPHGRPVWHEITREELFRLLGRS